VQRDAAERVRLRARWVLDTLGARDVAVEDVGVDTDAWRQVDEGRRPHGDELAEAFFHLARVEELSGPRDEHGRFPSGASCLDPLDPPLERLRRRLGVEPPRWQGARFAVALTHDVDSPWKWTRIGVRGAAARLKAHVRQRDARGARHEARALARMPLHKLRGTDPNWRFEAIVAGERERGARSTFFVLAAHRDRHDGAAPATYARLRPRLVETLLGVGAEVGLHGSYLAAETDAFLAEEKAELEALAGPVAGQRFHYLRLDARRHPAALARLGFRYDSTLGFADTIGFRGGIAQPFRPWDLDADRAVDLVEIPLAVMDATLAESRYLGVSAGDAERRLVGLLDHAAEHGGAFAVLWHPDRYDAATARGWDRLYFGLLDAVRERGGVCLSARELVAEAVAWLDRSPVAGEG
jgi:peptidoglycan/xylan/chitin deacetylase (PgdA/CDA1 family)